RPKTGEHDVQTKVNQARKFLEHNDKVQVIVLFRGREMQHVEEGKRVLDLVLAGLADAGKVERPPSMDGRQMTVLIMPNKPAAKPQPKRGRPTPGRSSPDGGRTTAPPPRRPSRGASPALQTTRGGRLPL